MCVCVTVLIELIDMYFCICALLIEVYPPDQPLIPAMPR